MASTRRHAAAGSSTWPSESRRVSRETLAPLSRRPRPRRLKYYQSEVDALSQFHDLKLVDSIALKVATIKQNLAQG